MSFLLRQTLRGIILMACVFPAGAGDAKPDNRGRGIEPQARISAPAVRLRKLHLVRPDLIPYPIAYEIYC